MFKYIEEIDLPLPAKLVERIIQETEQQSYPATDTIFGKMLEAARNNSYIETKFYNKDTFELFKEKMSTRVANLTPYAFSPVINLGLLKLLPEKLKQYSPTINFQTITNYENYSPHRDYVRLSSLFYLIKSNDSITKWWEPKEQFQNYFTGDGKYVPPAYDQVDVVKEHILEEGKWYVFDHESLHSVHTKFRNGCRISLLVSFPDLPAEQLYNIMAEAGHSVKNKGKALI